MRYIQSFSTSGDVQTALDNGSLGKPYVAYIESDSVIDWNTKEKEEDYKSIPLTFEIISGGTLKWTGGYNFNKTISYSIDNGATWTDITSALGSSAPAINVNDGDKIMFKGDNTTYSDGTETGKRVKFTSSDVIFNVYGNIMSIIDSTGFTTATTISDSFALADFFNELSGLVSAENLVLPATNLSFGCYNYMFFNCTSLTKAPELPATTLTNYCYRRMFQGCNSLNYVKCLATDISASQCTGFWLYNVASTGTFVKNASMTGWPTGNSGIPEGWTVIDA